jgi:Fe-S cluster biogenesis protein NfuA
MPTTELYNRVNASLDAIRPYLEADGGNISLIEVTEDMTAVVELQGACTHCSMSTMTMKAGVEGAIRSAVPEIKAVVAANIPLMEEGLTEQK